MQINSKIKLSVILPIYNVEPFLEKCILSIENQDLSKESYEIICINDGSPDNSKQIVIKLQNKFDNIILINQENQGVSAARNTGIKNAKGKYVLFIDTDDAIQENILKDLLYFTEKNNYEVVYSPLTTVKIDGTQIKSKFEDGYEELMEGSDLYYAVRGKEIKDPDHSVAILFNREFIIENDLFYVANIPYLEDAEYITRVMCLTKRGGIYDKPYYLRLIRPGAATQSDLFVQKRAVKGFILAAKNLEIFKREHNFSNKQKGIINRTIIKFVIMAVSASRKNLRNYIWVKKELKQNGFLKLDVTGADSFNKGLGIKYNKSIDYFYLSSVFNGIIKSFELKFKKI